MAPIPGSTRVVVPANRVYKVGLASDQFPGNSVRVSPDVRLCRHDNPLGCVVQSAIVRAMWVCKAQEETRVA